jgi:predicted transcriptional regulator
MARKQLLPRRPRLTAPPQPTPEQIAQIEEGLRQLEAMGLIERDREAEAKDGKLHIRLPLHKP